MEIAAHYTKFLAQLPGLKELVVYGWNMTERGFSRFVLQHNAASYSSSITTLSVSTGGLGVGAGCAVCIALPQLRHLRIGCGIYDHPPDENSTHLSADLFLPLRLSAIESVRRRPRGCWYQWNM